MERSGLERSKSCLIHFILRLYTNMDVSGSDHHTFTSQSNTDLELAAQHPQGNRLLSNTECNIPH